MNKTQSLHIRGAVLVGLSCLAVAACSPKQGEFGDQLFPHGKWEQIPPAPDNMVEVITLRHAVAFADGQAGLGLAEQSDLTNFIRENRIAAADEIVVQAAGGDRDRLMVGRLTAVKAEFARHGLVAAETLVSPASSTAAVPGEEDARLQEWLAQGLIEVDAKASERSSLRRSDCDHEQVFDLPQEAMRVDQILHV